MVERTQEVQGSAQAAESEGPSLEVLVESLSSTSRRERQEAATKLAALAKSDPGSLVPYGSAVIEALGLPEAQTRWKCLDILTLLVSYDSRTCDKAIAAAETSLFDEESGPVRLAAMRFLCRLGSTTENRSEKTWPLIDEAIQCYHGDPEFQDMLVAVVDFSAGKLSAHVREGLVGRMTFDATNGRGALKRRAQQIIDNAQAK